MLQLLFTDPLGRVDKSLMTDITLMELLVEGFLYKERIAGEPVRPIYKWKGVIAHSESQEIRRIVWSHVKQEGTLELKWLPNNLIRFHCYGNELKGTCDLDALPGTLVELDIRDNHRFASAHDVF